MPLPAALCSYHAMSDGWPALKRHGGGDGGGVQDLLILQLLMNIVNTVGAADSYRSAAHATSCWE